MSSPFSVVSTFSGCGGSSLGYALAGGRVLLANDFDEHAAETYVTNFPDTFFIGGDVADLGVDQIMKETGLTRGELDLLDGSPPCQGFSTAGSRNLFDERNYLFLEFVRILQGLMPRTFVMENVAGMIRGRQRVLFAEIFRRLSGVGYKVKAKLLDASLLGVPQRRRRVVFIGVRDELNVEPAFPVPDSVPVACGPVLAGLPVDSSVTVHEGSVWVWARTQPGKSFSTVHPKGYWFNAVKVNPAAPAPTITAMVAPACKYFCNGAFHWEHPRTLNIAEIKRVSTFPDDFKISGSFADQWSRIGNSVPPKMMAAIADTINRKILQVC